MKLYLRIAATLCRILNSLFTIQMTMQEVSESNPMFSPVEECIISNNGIACECRADHDHLQSDNYE